MVNTVVRLAIPPTKVQDIIDSFTKIRDIWLGEFEEDASSETSGAEIDSNVEVGQDDRD